MKMDPHDQPSLDMTKEAYVAYIDWGKSGFPTPIPETLESKLTKNSLELMVADARWYGESGVQLHGNVDIVDLKMVEQTKKSAKVQIVVDDSHLSFTVNGVPRGKLRNEVATVDVNLVYDGNWKVDRIDTLRRTQS